MAVNGSLAHADEEGVSEAGIQRCDVRQPQADGGLGGAEGWYSMLTPLVREAVRAAQDRKAVDLDLLDLKGVGSFTDFFLICSGTSSRHTQAISDAIMEQLEKSGVSPQHVEGYAEAQWILMDYLDFVVHIFSEQARRFYDLEWLWKRAARVKVEG